MQLSTLWDPHSNSKCAKVTLPYSDLSCSGNVPLTIFTDLKLPHMSIHIASLSVYESGYTLFAAALHCVAVVSSTMPVSPLRISNIHCWKSFGAKEIPKGSW